MTIAVIDKDTSYAIPDYDIDFFAAIAKRMGWEKIEPSKEEAKTESWVDKYAGKWQDSRSAREIIADIHAARTANGEISL